MRSDIGESDPELREFLAKAWLCQARLMVGSYKGMTHYTFDRDSDGKSAFSGPCVANWPVLKAESGDKPADGYTVFSHDNGSKQWAYKGKPLYTFAKAPKIRRRERRRFPKGGWHIAKP